MYFVHVDTIRYNKRKSLLVHLIYTKIPTMVLNISVFVSIRVIFYPDFLFFFFSFFRWVFYLLILGLLDIFLLLCLTFSNLFRLNFCEKACKPVLSLIPLGRLGLEALYLLKAFSHSYFFTVEHRQWR